MNRMTLIKDISVPSSWSHRNRAPLTQAYRVAVIENEPGETPPGLLTALREIDAEVRIMAAAAAARAGAADGQWPDLYLVPAAVSEYVLGEIGSRSGDGVARPILVYADSDFDELDRHALLGRDYTIPPFRPRLLLARLRMCYQRARMGRLIHESAVQAKLLAYDRELQIGREIQNGFLPDTLPQPDGWELDVRFRPAQMVAGDFYDAFELANGRRIAIVVADVCDKGVGAALFMALIRTLIRHTAEYSGLQSLLATGVEPAVGADALPVIGVTSMINAVRGTNGYLTRNHRRQGYFATLFFGVLDPATGRLAYINGGHNPPVIFGPQMDAPVVLEMTGPAVGVVPDCGYSVGHAQIGEGQTLLIYTDGVTDARSAGNESFGEQRLMTVVTAGAGPAAGPATGSVAASGTQFGTQSGMESGTETGMESGTESAAGLLDRLEGRLRGHVGEAEQFDDITMLALHRRSVRSGSASEAA